MGETRPHVAVPGIEAERGERGRVENRFGEEEKRRLRPQMTISLLERKEHGAERGRVENKFGEGLRVGCGRVWAIAYKAQPPPNAGAHPPRPSPGE